MPRWGNQDGSDSVPNRVDGPSIPRSNVDPASLGAGPAKKLTLPDFFPEGPGVGTNADRRGNWAVPVGDANRMPMTSEQRRGHRMLHVHEPELMQMLEELLIVNKAILAQMRLLCNEIAPADLGEVSNQRE